MADYAATRDRVEHYFDRSATKVWERLTSDAPVSGIRATVRAGREQMREMMLRQLPDDLRGARILDAGCGTGAMSVELAKRGAEVVGVDISPALIEIAQKRMPANLDQHITFVSGDMLEATKGGFDHALAMDSLIYYNAPDIAELLGRAARRVNGKFIFTLPPRTPALMAMFRVGKLFPRADRSPVMIPQSAATVANELRKAGVAGRLREIDRVKSGFYFSSALVFEGGR
ncbi:magnesium protoporphyrin IX methyltransferase [Yoonia sediminilitoris]|uniref:Magnesium protoporphyrin IX methyltransferase n=1 Tax=Yoonia sediminilitoris TaxID=1286148 RepID=A0A2T6KMJ5_9RHOB|nr:magnesium protoporphyrin IX methyltransferase [Yoonia sediminilitoris]PUB17426.1 Mg-protoporphyrin IX methyltransferase [Yoonia sediminilitoris]RCW97721.1 Mg-protoporphyrin IX methyltransferase [Yoonia sediminilitoris]